MKHLTLILFYLSPFWLASQSLDSANDDPLGLNEVRKSELASKLQDGLARLRIGEKMVEKYSSPDEEINKDVDKEDAIEQGHKIMLEAYLEIASIFQQEHYHEKALVYYGYATKLVTDLEWYDARLEILTKTAQSLFENGEWEEAYSKSVETYEQHQQLGQYAPAIKDLERMAECALQLNNLVKAREHYVEIMEIASIVKDMPVQMTAMNNMGYAAAKLENYKEAIHYFGQSEQLAESNAPITPGFIFTNLGISWNNIGDKDRALKNLKTAVKKDAESKSYIQHLISSIYLTDNDIYNALNYNELAIEEAGKTEDMVVMADAYGMASDIYQQLFQHDKALFFYKKHLALKDSLERIKLLEQKEMENIHAFLEDTENNFRQIQFESELEQANLEQAELRNKALALEFEAHKQTLEREKKEQQIALLEKEKQAEEANVRAAQLEAEKTRRDLALATQANLLLERQKQLDSLHQQRQLDSLDAARLLAEQQKQFAEEESRKELERKEKEQAEFRSKIYSLGALGLLIFALITGSWLYGRKLNRTLAKRNEKIEAQNKEIESERNRAEGLLLNILPAAIAYELKEKGAATPKHYDAVTVLFTDFEGFTAIAAEMHPEEVVKELNECFMKFDEIAEKYHLEKIKTIGDSYMCAGGLPVKNTTHPHDAVSAGKEMLTFIEQRNNRLKASGKPPWPIRIGIHTGELVAGVVGKRKFAYDIWGDTVNVASRMESNSEVGHINISEATYKLVGDKFHCKYRGELEVKHKGKMGMYIVDG